MIASVPSYDGKLYTIEDNMAVIRDPKKKWAILKDSRKRKRVIPVNTEVVITDVGTDSNRNVYVLASPTDRRLPKTPAGWTRATNLAGKFLNELIGYVPAKWTLEPQGTNYTVTDHKAVIRRDFPPYSAVSGKKIIPPGTAVIVTARSEATKPVGKYVQVSHGEMKNDRSSRGEHIGFTAASNLTPGWSPFFASSDWANQKGDNACWRSGAYVGAKVLVNIVGTGGQMQRIARDLLAAYLGLKDSAAESNIDISINSGFRTFAKQKRLYDLYKKGKGNLAAKPGRSNHQHGQALDLSTHGFDGDPVYDWMKKNATKFGFIRTVNKEHWHWEFRPKEAAKLGAKGKFKLSKVKT